MNSSGLSQPTVDDLHTNNVVPLRSAPGSDTAGLGYLATDDGHNIPVRHWPHASPKAVILIAHGMAEHSGCYEDVAARFQTAGFAVMAHDHRCHGLSVPVAALGNVSDKQYWKAIISDMMRVNNHARATYPGKPVMLLGHSMGSFISMIFAQSHSDRIDALMLEGSNYQSPLFCRMARGIAVVESWRQGQDGRSPIIHELSFGGFNKTIRNPRTANDWLSRNMAFVDRYTADPLCGFQCSNGYWKQFLAGLVKLYEPRNMAKIRRDLPIYLFAGSEDPVGRRGRGVMELRQQLEKTDRKPVQMRLYPGARHDILHETNHTEITRDLVNWLHHSLPVSA